MKSRWSEIRNHHDEIDGVPKKDDIVSCIAIDAYANDDDNEPGEVIAKVILTATGDTGVVYINNLARADKYAQEVIKETIDNLKNETDLILSKDGKSVGRIINFSAKPCNMEGCSSDRVSVRWDDGSLSYPCGSMIVQIREHLYKLN